MKYQCKETYIVYGINDNPDTELIDKEQIDTATATHQ